MRLILELDTLRSFDIALSDGSIEVNQLVVYICAAGTETYNR